MAGRHEGTIVLGWWPSCVWEPDLHVERDTPLRGLVFGQRFAAVVDAEGMLVALVPEVSGGYGQALPDLVCEALQRLACEVHPVVGDGLEVVPLDTSAPIE